MAVVVATLEPEAQASRCPSFDEVYASSFRKVVGWVRAHGCPEADIEDVTQEVFVVVQRKLPDFDGRHLPSWLYRITARKVRDHRRSAWFRHWFSRPSDEVDELVSTNRTAPELIEAREARQSLQEILARMKPKSRRAFVLFELEGVSGEEIATLEGTSVAAVWTRLHRARKEFATMVAASLDGEGP